MRILSLLVLTTTFVVGCSKQPDTVGSTSTEPKAADVKVAEEVTSSPVVGNENTKEETTDSDLVAKETLTENKLTVELADEPIVAPAEKAYKPETYAATQTSVNEQEDSIITKVLDQQASQNEVAQNEVAQKVELEPIPEKAPDAPAKVDSIVNLDGYSFYGDPSQPGYQIQVAIFTLVEQGMSITDASREILKSIIRNQDSVVSGTAQQMVSQNFSVSKQLIGDVANVTNLSDATKLSIESLPENVDTIVTLGVTLYPDYAQEVITAAALTGEISDDDAILLAIAAGADPTLISAATAATATAGIIAAPTPLGTGIGAGGAGGGDSTVSTN